MKKFSPLLKFIIVLAILAYFIVSNFQVFLNVLMVLIGFGAVIFIHELGHFTLGKLSNMNVQAFCLGFHPLLIGVIKTERGLKVRILPRFFPKEDQKGEEGDGKLSFTIPMKNNKPGETEYRIGLIPFGGFVKVLGQEDVGVAEVNQDPRSFVNKPVSSRIAMVSAGVIFNAISAIIIFMITFMIGVKLPPAMVGDVVPNSPAAQAGFQPGDRILEVNGKKALDFTDVLLAGPLSGRGEEIDFKVRSEDGQIKNFGVLAEERPGEKLRGVGIIPPTSLTIGKPQEKQQQQTLLEETKLKGGDKVIAVNDKPVETFWQFNEILKNIDSSSVTITVERQVEDKVKQITTELPLEYLLPLSSVQDPNSNSQIGNFYTMVPRLKIPQAKTENSPNLSKQGLHPGDVIIKVEDINNPTYKELRDMTRQFQGKTLNMTVLRNSQEVTVETKPELDKKSGHVMLGIPLEYDFSSPVIAKTVNTEDINALNIPGGARIESVAGRQVKSFTDVINIVKQNQGRQIQLSYSTNGSENSVSFLADPNNFSAVSLLGGEIPFEQMREIQKASNPLQALEMGFKKTVDLIITTYLTLKQLFLGLVSPAALSGPIGIVSMSYKIVAQQSLVYYLYFMALISAAIAVFNFLPLPVMDGGVVVMLLIEKLRGKPLSQKAQGIINYVGLLMILTIFVLVTFNDIKNIFM